MKSWITYLLQRWPILILAAVFFFCGCTGLHSRSPYTRPEVKLPGQWQAQTATGSTMADDDRFWRDFNDPTLSRLIEHGLTTNNDLAAAAIKVRRARLNAGLTDTNVRPSVSVGGEGSINRDLKQKVNTRSFSITGAVSYELDLWKKLGAARDAGHWEAMATEADRQSAAMTLIGDIASHHWQIAYLNQRIANTEAGIAYAEKTLALVEVQYSAGAVSALDQIQAKQALVLRQAEMPGLLRQRTEAHNALSILFNQGPENPVAELQQLPDGPLPTIAAGLPASLVDRRPDLRAAELRMKKYLANMDQARASFYPAFALTGSLGTASTHLTDVLKNPVLALGTGLTLPFIQWDVMKLNVEISMTEYEEAVVNFRQSLYSALCDVENALFACSRYDEESRHIEAALALAKKAEGLAEIRYRAGSTGLQSWLDAQESRRSAENDLAENRLSRLNNRMTLYQAIGGSMTREATTEPDRPSPKG